MGRPAPAQVLKVVRDLLRQTDRGALADDDLRLALRSLLSPDAAHGAQTPVDFHTPRRPSPRMQDLAKNRSVRRRLADYRELGQKAGLNNPAAAQAAAWRGGAHITGVESPDAPFVVMFADRVLELAKKHGLSFREALATVARGDRELLGIAAGAPILMSALMDEGEVSS